MNNPNKTYIPYVVIGGGFPGLFAAYYLSKHHKKTILFDAGKKMGGVMQPIEFNGLKMDIGTHYINDVFPEITEHLLDMANHTLQPINPHTGSRYYNHISPQVHYPDLTGLDSQIIKKIEAELFNNTSLMPKHFTTLQHYIEKNWGKTALLHLTPMIQKITNHHPKDLDKTSIYYRWFSKIIIPQTSSKQNLMIYLLHSLELILHKINQKIPLPKFYSIINILNFANKQNRLINNDNNQPHAVGHSYYPEKRYIGAFTEEILTTLTRQDVILKNETPIVNIQKTNDNKMMLTTKQGDVYLTDYIFWGNQLSQLEPLILNSNHLKDKESSSGLLLIYFQLTSEHNPPSHIGYFEQLDSDMLLWRISFNHGYVNDDKKNIKHYVAIELPMNQQTYEKSDIESIKKQLWQEIITLKLLTGNMPTDHMHLYNPHIFKLFLTDHRQKSKEITKKIKQKFSYINFLEPSSFDRNVIAKKIINILNPIINS